LLITSAEIELQSDLIDFWQMLRLIKIVEAQTTAFTVIPVQQLFVEQRNRELEAENN